MGGNRGDCLKYSVLCTRKTRQQERRTTKKIIATVADVPAYPARCRLSPANTHWATDDVVLHCWRVLLCKCTALCTALTRAQRSPLGTRKEAFFEEYSENVLVSGTVLLLLYYREH